MEEAASGNRKTSDLGYDKLNLYDNFLNNSPSFSSEFIYLSSRNIYNVMHEEKIKRLYDLKRASESGGGEEKIARGACKRKA